MEFHKYAIGPTAIEELHWDNYTVTENINLSTGRVEFVLGHPLDMDGNTNVDQSIAGHETKHTGKL